MWQLLPVVDLEIKDVKEDFWGEEEACNTVDFKVEREEDVLEELCIGVVFEAVELFSVVFIVVFCVVVRVGIFIGISDVNWNGVSFVVNSVAVVGKAGRKWC